MSYENTVNYLYSLQKYGIKLGLDNIRKLLSSFGNPQNSFRSIHIAGTNGKGSTSAMIASILQASGFKTGLFTSPHLVSFTERIRINNEHITENAVVELAEEIKNVIHDTGCKMQDKKIMNHESCIVHQAFNPTFFEVVTAMAFLYFKRNNIEWAVIETGMGGRLDATNVIIPEVSVLTSISYDHSEFLGDTISAIAGEKAGIIKSSTPVVTAMQEPEVIDVIRKTSEKKDSKVFEYGKDFSASLTAGDINGSVFDYSGAENIEGLEVPLSGEHQILNAALALKTIEIISKKSLPHQSPFTPQAVRAGLKNAIWQGRLEFISNNPPIIIDGAHNAAASAALAGALRKNFLAKYDKLIIILGIMSDKDIKGIMRPLLPLASEIILTAPGYERSARPSELAKYASALGFSNVHTAETVIEAIEMAIKLGESLSGESVNKKMVNRSIGESMNRKKKNPVAPINLLTHSPFHLSVYSPIHPFTHPLILIAGSFYTIGEAKEALGAKGILSGLREKL